MTAVRLLTGTLGHPFHRPTTTSLFNALFLLLFLREAVKRLRSGGRGGVTSPLNRRFSLPAVITTTIIPKSLRKLRGRERESKSPPGRLPRLFVSTECNDRAAGIFCFFFLVSSSQRAFDTHRVSRSCRHLANVALRPPPTGGEMALIFPS